MEVAMNLALIGIAAIAATTGVAYAASACGLF